MNNLQNLYKKLWQSMIRPKRFPYTEQDLGGSLLIFETGYALRLDFQLQNALGEKFYVSIYFPCTKEEEVPKNIDFMIYCHTHNACRIEGLILLEKLLKIGMGLVVFDFRANGFSSGKFVTLGWLEALDINTVATFLINEVKAGSVSLWGRSMGASAIIFFMSDLYRKQMEGILVKKNKTKISWVSKKAISCIILDSPFGNLTETIHYLVKGKVKSIPSWLINLTIKLLDSDIKKNAGISLYKINPNRHVQYLKTPCFMILGNNDEMIDTETFYKMHKDVGSKIKKVVLFNGSHADERPDDLESKIVGFMRHILHLRRNYVSNKQIVRTGLDNSITNNYLDYTQTQLHENTKNEGNSTRLLVSKRNYIPNLNQNNIPPKEDFKKKFKKSYIENQRFAAMKKSQLSKAMRLSMRPINLGEGSNQFDLNQIDNNEKEINEKRNVIDKLKANFFDVNNYNEDKEDQNGLDDFTLRFIPNTHINERFTTIIERSHDPLMKNGNKPLRHDNSFEVYIQNNKSPSRNIEMLNKKKQISNHLSPLHYSSSQNNVFVPQYNNIKSNLNNFPISNKEILKVNAVRINSGAYRSPQINERTEKANTLFKNYYQNVDKMFRKKSDKIETTFVKEPGIRNRGKSQNVVNFIETEEKVLDKIDIVESEPVFFKFTNKRWSKSFKYK